MRALWSMSRLSINNLLDINDNYCINCRVTALIELGNPQAKSDNSPMNFEQNDLIKLTTVKMPFGKYAGRPLIDLPETYIVWFYSQGFPNTELGKLLGLLYEIKLNGLEDLVEPLRNFSNSSNFPKETN